MCERTGQIDWRYTLCEVFTLSVIANDVKRRGTDHALILPDDSGKRLSVAVETLFDEDAGVHLFCFFQEPQV